MARGSQYITILMGGKKKKKVINQYIRLNKRIEQGEIKQREGKKKIQKFLVV